eukprot:CAMPEP_0115676280 /NCGR_PEP_ID=MMETSP0272-20121206/54605_1 /TAXON_ID=71861 /ORGANISM="Scrippsiella trochoidea, Strain CCMP3099" /LENGTH=182 /DNA_ID=CAMNT_0003115315 /DNA_START=258 /DNA_END=803 /DNA_ORIENTATION=+
MAANSAAVEGLSPEVVGRADKGGAPEAAAALQVGGRWGGTAPAVVKRGEAPAICHGIGNAGAAPAGTEGAADTTGARADASAAAGPAGCASSAPENILKLSSDWGKPAAPPRRAEFMLNIDPAVLKQALVVAKASGAMMLLLLPDSEQHCTVSYAGGSYVALLPAQRPRPTLDAREQGSCSA